MAFELTPDIEQQIKAAADRAGIAIDELLRRTFALAPPAMPLLPNRAKPVNEETHARVMATLAARQKEYGMPVPPGGFKTLAELSAEWQAEDAHLTDEEREAERQFWEDFNRERDYRPLQI